MKILVALSGGIDSSTVAHLLSAQGHELVGVRFILWTDPLAPPLAEILPSKCCSAQTAARASHVAKKLGIPLYVSDLQAEFKRCVVDPFLEAHRRGLTPNPCIGCNREIKFGKLLALMRELRCARLATGHYARVATETLHDGSARHLLLEALDATKDQSYYLYALTQEQLSRVLFPLGTMFKRDVYALARHFGVPFDANYRESQDLCFFPEKSPRAFLKRHLRDALEPGAIVRRDGTVVGAHEGLPLYTIGQRRGLNVGGLTVPLEVVAKDASGNRLIVAPKGTEHAHRIYVTDLRWVSWRPAEGEPAPFECRTRSLAERRSGTFSYAGKRGTFLLASPLPPQSRGQSLVLYRGKEVVGGGVIR